MRTVLSMLFVALATPAGAEEDPSAIASDLAHRFVRSCERGDVAGALSLYVDDAMVVYPGEGARADGRAELERVLAAMCVPDGGASRFTGGRGAWLGPDRNAIRASGAWESTGTGPNGQPVTARVRTTELLVRTPAGWRYALDHASVGLPVPSPATGP